MPVLKNVLGLDLGSHSIKAVELRQTLRGLEPVQLRLHPNADTEAPLAEVLRPFLRLHHLPTDYVICALPGDRISSRRLQFPFRDRKKLRQAVPFEVEGEIPLPIEQVLVDWEIISGERAQATVNTCITQRRHVAAILEELREANCEPRILEAEGLVLSNLCSLFDLPGTRLLIDIGHRKTTSCLLMDGRSIATRTLAVGGHALTEAIAADRGWNREDAERAKCEDGIFHAGLSSASPGALSVLDRIARETVRTLESLEPILGGSPQSKVDAITLFGGSAKLHRIDEYLAERTGIETARLGLPPEGEGAALVAGGDPVLFAPAIALALRGTARSSTRMNFRQDEFSYRTDLRQLLGTDTRLTAALAAGVALLMGVGVATSIALDSRRAARLESQVASIYADAFPEAPATSNPIAAMRQAGVLARERADFLGVYGDNSSALDILAALSAHVPPDLEVKFEEVVIDRRVVRIKVFAKSYEAADRLTAELAATPMFAAAKVDGEIKSSRKNEGKTFNVSIALDVPGSES